MIRDVTEVLAPLGEQVRELRIHAGWTQQVLADRASVGTQALSRLENGQPVSLPVLVAVVRELGREEWFNQLAPSGQGPSPMELLRQQANKPARPRRVRSR
ncbi:MAG: helix-turn-helix domain-containing protein [Promicromonosporaceae bacterium]|jgi:transcriptional regulator with XRE-family HTH domain|nr:helix-turn-helix domain-containing protein [Promicromonosporaceae bacterium]